MKQASDSPILDHSYLMTLELDVAAAQSRQIGQTADGRRVIAPITGGSFEGPRLRGTVLPGGADWVRMRPDGAMSIDVRLTLETDDGVPIYLTYQGRLLASPEMFAELARGKSLDPSRYSLATVAKFETGDERYAWLNDLIVVGTGEQSGFNPTYHLFQIGRSPG